MDAELDEGALVDQQRDPLPRGELFALVLLGDLLLAAPEPDLRAPGVQVLDERAQQRCRCLRRVHQRPFQTGSRFSKNAVTPSTMSSVDMARDSWARR